VTSLFHGGETLQEDLLDPGNDFVGRRVGWLIEIDDTVLDVFFNGSLKRGVALGNGGVVAGLGVETVVILDRVRREKIMKFGTFKRRGQSEESHLAAPLLGFN